MTLSIGEPKRNKDYHRAVSPKRKSDASESQAMARFAVVEQPGPTPGALEETSLLREIAGRLEAQVKTTTQAVNRLHNLLSRSFPELAQIVPDIAAGYVLSLLSKYPTRVSAPRMIPPIRKPIRPSGAISTPVLGKKIRLRLVSKKIVEN